MFLPGFQHFFEKYKYLEKKKIGKEHQHGLLTEPRKKAVRFQYLTLTHVLKHVAYVNKSLNMRCQDNIMAWSI